MGLYTCLRGVWPDPDARSLLERLPLGTVEQHALKVHPVGQAGGQVIPVPEVFQRRQTR